MEKKESIFASLSPAPAPVPASAPRAAAPDQELAALKQKMELMEKSIVTQLEKKITEARSAAPPLPPRPPDQAPQLLLGKIAELEKKLEEFARAAAASSAQTRNSEESRAGGRREIEELLKVVREQQKYSELDRQMHDQLEKSWSRVEELEKRLMDFYSSASAKSAPAPETGPLELAKAVETGINKAFEEAARGTAEKFAVLGAGLDSKLAAFELELQTMRLNAAKAAAGHAEELLARSEKEEAALRRVEAGAEANAQKARTELSALEGRVEEMVRRSVTIMSARVQAETSAAADRIMEFSGLSAYSLAGAAALVRNLGELQSRLEGLAGAVKVFVQGLNGAHLDSLLGVSGEAARKNFEGLKKSLGEMDETLAYFERQKKEIAGDLARAAKKEEP